MQPCEVEPLPPIEETALPEIDVAESQEGTKRKMLAQRLEAPAPADVGALNLTGVEVSGSGDACFPIRVAVVFFHEDIDGRKGVMIHQRMKAIRGAFDDDVFVDLIIATRGFDVGDFFVTAEFVTKETEVPVGEIGVLQPFAHKHETPVDPVAVGGVVRIRDDGTHFGLSGGFEDLVGIENEHPLVTEGERFKRPIFLFGPGAIELKLHDLGTHRSGDILRAICACRIDHENLISPSNGFQASG